MDERYKQVEIRSFSGDASPKISEDESRTIEGYAIVFGVRSQVMVDWGGEYFEEVILPEAVSEELIRKSDIKALMEHNRERLLARSSHGVGTLELSIDSFGLKYRFTAPNTTDGNDALELVRRGDLSGSSFGFYAYSEGAVERAWQEDKKRWLYSVRKIDLLTDVTITSSPAYTQTRVEVRSLCAPTTSSTHEAVGASDQQGKDGTAPSGDGSAPPHLAQKERQCASAPSAENGSGSLDSQLSRSAEVGSGTPEGVSQPQTAPRPSADLQRYIERCAPLPVADWEGRARATE